jgi:hypothetical protein
MTGFHPEIHAGFTSFTMKNAAIHRNLTGYITNPNDFNGFYITGKPPDWVTPSWRGHLAKGRIPVCWAFLSPFHKFWVGGKILIQTL